MFCLLFLSIHKFFNFIQSIFFATGSMFLDYVFFWRCVALQHGFLLVQEKCRADQEALELSYHVASTKWKLHPIPSAHCSTRPWRRPTVPGPTHIKAPFIRPPGGRARSSNPRSHPLLSALQPRRPHHLIRRLAALPTFAWSKRAGCRTETLIPKHVTTPETPAPSTHFVRLNL